MLQKICCRKSKGPCKSHLHGERVTLLSSQSLSALASDQASGKTAWKGSLGALLEEAGTAERL